MNRNRLTFAALAVAIMAPVALPLSAATWTNLPGVTTTGAGSPIAFTSTPGLQAHIYSTAGSSATVVVQGAMSSSGPWLTVATVTNPSATGECYQGTTFPHMRANATARASGTLYAVFRDLAEDPGPWAPCIASATSTAPTYGLIKYSYTNAQIVAAGSGVGPLNVSIGTLPAKSVVTKTHLVVDGQATFAAGNLTGAVGGTATAYVDLIVASDLKAAAGVIYGDAAAEKGATNLGHLYSAAAKPLTLQILASAGNLADVTGASGTVFVEYVVYP